MQQPQGQAAALAVAPSASAVAHPNDPAGGDAPPKQVAQAMERLGGAGRLIAEIRLGADRLLEALFVAGGAPPYSAPQHIDRTSRAIVQEEAAMRRHFQDLRALGRYQPLASLPALTPPFPLLSRSGRLWIITWVSIQKIWLRSTCCSIVECQMSNLTESNSDPVADERFK